MTGALFMDDCSGDSMVVARQSSVSSQGDNSLACVKCFDPSGFALHCHFELIGDPVCSSLGLIMEQILHEGQLNKKKNKKVQESLNSTLNFSYLLR